ncbi:MAG: D-2-hydroxyacid dehydrogenase [Dehalococcoidia bacterium]|nr:D-2-hydroxyacid dehydrogenase [Dehalococcoidia bacterium]
MRHVIGVVWPNLTADQVAQIRAVTDAPIVDLTDLTLRLAASDDAALLAEYQRLARDVTILLYSGAPFPRVRGMMPNLRWAQLPWAGSEQFLQESGCGPDVVITTASGVGARAIAEYTVGAIISLVKNFPRYAQQKAERRWKRRFTDELAGKTVAIYGVGAIGREVARLLAPFDVRVIGMTRTGGAPPPGVERLYPTSDLIEMLREADVLVVAAPRTDQTRGAIGAEALAALKPSAGVVNVARGDIVDEAALAAMLAEGRLAGAALDVFTEEPLPPDSPFWSLDNVLLTPHIAGVAPAYQSRLLALFCDNLRRFLANEPLINRYDPARGY